MAVETFSSGLQSIWRIAGLGLPPLRLDALGLEGCSLLTDAALDAFFAAGGSVERGCVK